MLLSCVVKIKSLPIYVRISCYHYFKVSLCCFCSGFHEAVGDTIALSVSSPKHLRRVGLVTGDAEDEQTEINQLYKMVMLVTECFVIVNFVKST